MQQTRQRNAAVALAALLAVGALACTEARPTSAADAGDAQSDVATPDAAAADAVADVPAPPTCTIAPGCDDGNDCTAESCDALSACRHKAVPGPCDDGNACTQGEQCQYAICQHGTPVTCSNPEPDCALVACEPKLGCVTTPWPDGSPCGVPDACSDHACVAGKCVPVATSPCNGPVWKTSLHITKAISLALADPSAGVGCAAGSPLSAAAWIRPSAQGVPLAVAAMGGVALWVQVSASTVQVGLAMEPATTLGPPLHTAPWLPGHWVHVAVGVDSAGHARGYIDGQPGAEVKLSVVVKPGKVQVANLPAKVPAAGALPLKPFVGDITQLYWGCTHKLRGAFSPVKYPTQASATWLEAGAVLSANDPATKGANWQPDGPYASPTMYHADCRVGACAGPAGTCTFATAPDGSRCWDGDACHTGTCLAGKCTISQLNCSDGDPATTDQCHSGACVHFKPAQGCNGDPAAVPCQKCAQAGTQGWSCDTCKQSDKLGISCLKPLPPDAVVVAGAVLQVGCDAESQAEPVPVADVQYWCDKCSAAAPISTLPDWYGDEAAAHLIACSKCAPGACTKLEKPAAQVVVSHSLLVKKHEVTRGEWLELEAVDPSEAATCSSCPVTNINQFEAMHYANLRSKADGAVPCYDLSKCSGTVGVDYTCADAPGTGLATGQPCGWRLPSEAEWELLARGAATGENTGVLAEVAWFDDNAQGVVSAVGLKKPNSNGLFDVQGNVWEWTSGPVATASYFPGSPTVAAWPIVPTDGPWCWPTPAEGGLTAPGWFCGWSSCSEPCPALETTTADAVLRGCSATDSRLTCRLSYRYLTSPTHRSAYAGLRLLRTIADL